MNYNRQHVIVGSAIYIDDVGNGELYGNCSDNLLYDSTCTMMESIENEVNACTSIAYFSKHSSMDKQKLYLFFFKYTLF